MRLGAKINRGFSDLRQHYWKNCRGRIDRVNKDDVLAVVRKYLMLDRLVILVVGEKGNPAWPTRIIQ
jgi:hypothetical protein